MTGPVAQGTPRETAINPLADQKPRRPRPLRAAGWAVPAPPLSAPAFPDGIRARVRSEEDPCLFILRAFLPREAAVSTQIRVVVRATGGARPHRCARPCAPPTPTPQQPPRGPSRRRRRSHCSPRCLRRRSLLSVTRKCFFPKPSGETSERWGVEVAAGHRPQYAAITLSALEGLDGEPVSPTPGSQRGA